MQFSPTLTEEDRARADYYALLGRFFFDAPDAALLQAVAAAAPVAGESDAAFAAAWAALQAACRDVDVTAAGFEFSTVFVGTGKALVTPYSSFYVADSVRERHLVRLRGTLAQLGLGRIGGAGIYEDHIASLCEVMRHLVLQGSGVAALQQQKDLFINYIQPCYETFSRNVEACDQAVFYKHICRFAKAFFDIEAEALSMV